MISDYWIKPPGDDDYRGAGEGYYVERQWLRQIEDQAASPLHAWLTKQVLWDERVVPGSSQRYAADTALKRFLLDDHPLNVDATFDEKRRLVVHRSCSCQHDGGIVEGEYPCQTIKKTAATYTDMPGYAEACAAEDEITAAVHTTWYWREEQ